MEPNYMNIKMASILLSKFYRQCDLPVYAIKLESTDIHNPKELERLKKHVKEVAELFNNALEEIEEIEKLED